MLSCHILLSDQLLIKFTGHYTNNKTAVVPWLEVARENSRFLRADSILETIQLKEPTKLKAEEVSQFWALWFDNQREGKRGLSFIDCLVKDRRELVLSEKASAEEVEPNDDSSTEDSHATSVEHDVEQDNSEVEHDLELDDRYPITHNGSRNSRLTFLKSLSEAQELQALCDFLVNMVSRSYNGL